LSCPKLIAKTIASRRNAAVALLMTEFAHSAADFISFAAQKWLPDRFVVFESSTRTIAAVLSKTAVSRQARELSEGGLSVEAFFHCLFVFRPTAKSFS
jgi:hypothetical protein